MKNLYSGDKTLVLEGFGSFSPSVIDQTRVSRAGCVQVKSPCGEQKEAEQIGNDLAFNLFWIYLHLYANICL